MSSRRTGRTPGVGSLSESRQSLPDQGSGQPDLMAALAKSLDRPTWVIHLAKHGGPGRSRSETWVGVAEDRDTANTAALAWVRDPLFYVSYADGPFVPVRERDRLRAENEALDAENGRLREAADNAMARIRV